MDSNIILLQFVKPGNIRDSAFCKEVDSKTDRSAVSEERAEPGFLPGCSLIILPPCLHVGSSVSTLSEKYSSVVPQLSDTMPLNILHIVSHKKC